MSHLQISFHLSFPAFSYMNQKDGEHIPNNHIQSVFDKLNAPIKVTEVYDSYYNNIQSGTGSFHLYQSHDKHVSIGIDYYRYLTDQLDFTAIYIRTGINIDFTKNKLRQFFDSVPKIYQHIYHEGQSLQTVRDALEEKNYPKLRQGDYNHTYHQKMKVTIFKHKGEIDY